MKWDRGPIRVERKERSLIWREGEFATAFSPVHSVFGWHSVFPRVAGSAAFARNGETALKEGFPP